MDGRRMRRLIMFMFGMVLFNTWAIGMIVAWIWRQS